MADPNGLFLGDFIDVKLAYIEYTLPIQRFDLRGRYLGEWSNLGKTFSLKLAEGALWIGTQPRNQPNGAPGWLMKIDRRSNESGF